MHNTYISKKLNTLHRSLLEIVGVMNRPQRDEAMIQEAGISLERALFSVLVLVERLGPIGVVELADRLGRDYTTVSRQVSKLEDLGLVSRMKNSKDRRIREATVTKSGKEITDRIDEARIRIGQAIFEKWSSSDVDEFIRLIGKFANDIKED
jgi:DNA-binding MarR family transcriptional regulator